MDSLIWQRVFSFSIIPRRLVEKVKTARKIDIDKLYLLDSVIFQNPFNLLFVLRDSEQNIRGFMWASISPLDSTIQGHMLSVEEQLYGQGAVAKAIDFLDKIRKLLNFRSIVFETTRPNAFKRLLGNKVKTLKSTFLEVI